MSLRTSTMSRPKAEPKNPSRRVKVFRVGSIRPDLDYQVACRLLTSIPSEKVSSGPLRLRVGERQPQVVSLFRLTCTTGGVHTQRRIGEVEKRNCALPHLTLVPGGLPNEGTRGNPGWRRLQVRTRRSLVGLFGRRLKLRLKRDG